MNEIAKQIIRCFKRGNVVFVCGNGGSAAESNHFAAEMVCKFKRKRKPLPMLSLSSDNAVITSIANDFGFEYIFSRQLEAFGRKGDLLITLSTSGKSKNIREVIAKAKELGIKTIEFPTNLETGLTTPETQFTHLTWLHEISLEVEKAFL